MAQQLDSALLQAILSSGAFGGTNLQGQYNSPDGSGTSLYTGSNGGGYYLDPMSGQIVGVGQGTQRDLYDRSGKLVGSGQDTGPSEDMMLAMLIASGLGGAYAGGAFGGAGSAAGGAGGAAATGATGSSITLPTMAELGVGAATVTPELAATMPALNIGTATAAGAGAGALTGSGSGGGSLGATGANSMRAGEIASYASNGGMPTSAAVPAASTGVGLLSGLTDSMGGNTANTLARLGLTAVAAHDARDQTQSSTTTREPWGPAQPFLKGLLDQGQQMQQQYAQQPFSPLQQQQYGNWFNQLGQAQGIGQGLLGAMAQTAGGANNYKRKG